MLHFARLTSRLFPLARGREKGGVTILVLIVMTLAGLTMAPALEFMATGVKAAAIERNLTDELYAADAGMEYAMWKIGTGVSTSFTEDITVGSSAVHVVATSLTSLPYGPVVTQGAEHADWLTVTTTLTDLGGGIYGLTIDIQNTGGSGNVKIETIGAGLPQGFSYVSGSSSGATTDAPLISSGRLTWTFEGAARPDLLEGQSASQSFSMTGAGNPQRYYSWVLASREDVGLVSSCIGFSVVSTAGETQIQAAVVNNQGIVYPVSWNISRMGAP